MELEKLIEQIDKLQMLAETLRVKQNEQSERLDEIYLWKEEVEDRFFNIGGR